MTETDMGDSFSDLCRGKTESIESRQFAICNRLNFPDEVVV